MVERFFILFGEGTAKRNKCAHFMKNGISSNNKVTVRPQPSNVCRGVWFNLLQEKKNKQAMMLNYHELVEKKRIHNN